ncbi:MAG: hypothetical protein R2932_07130 [Caldilineaceae bacterium]
MALVVADRQLFGGKNREVILTTARLNACEVADIHQAHDAKKVIDDLLAHQMESEMAGETRGGIPMNEIETEEEALTLDSDGAALLDDPTSLNYGLTIENEPTTVGLDLGQMWTDNLQTDEPISMNL